jgi:iron complex transport system substrate-binding protein
MRICSLDPALTETICYLGLEEGLVGISHRCNFPEAILKLPRLTTARSGSDGALRSLLGPDLVDIKALTDLKPDVIVAKIEEAQGSDENVRRARQLLGEQLAPLGLDAKLYSYDPRTLEQIFEMFDQLGKDLKVPTKGHDLSQRLKAQMMDWGDNFYDRMKNKRVTFLSGVDPFILAGCWIPDMIHLASAVSQVRVGGEDSLVVSWKDIVDFRPDVIVVAPQGQNLQQSMKNFFKLEKLPEWDTIPAVKRGEVVFADGSDHFFRASPRLRESMSILISAVAGLESGYISPRDSFQRLRWLEMQRHKI